MNIQLIYLPFCTPASPPYSLTYLYSFLKANSKHQISVLDLNLEFHKLKFPQYQKYYQGTEWDDYDKKSKEYHEVTKEVYSKNNHAVVDGENPELLSELLQQIIDQQPDIVAFSIVYSSQAFYVYAMLKEIKKLNEAGKINVKTVLGGPAVNEKISPLADKVLNNEIEFLEFIEKKTTDHSNLKLDFPIDYSLYDLKAYFTPQPVIPIKTSTTCYYKQCTFCAHHTNNKYFEFDLEPIVRTIKLSKQRYFFLIDDMIPSKRLLKMAEVFKPLNIKWACQLKPTKDFDFKTLKTLREAGLVLIIWGVESGSQRILDLMKKNTKKENVIEVLKNSHLAGIKNITYIMFGFPTETKEEFLETIELLKENQESIDLISTSVFGLQKGTPIYNNPELFGVTRINEQSRKVLEPKISYEVNEGLSQNEASLLRKRYKKTIGNINKYPRNMNFFKEHLLCLN
ncbi:MAG: B12-binding domain-containing radical SAM protein [Candidatus Woesearchaeota archaeon]